MGFNSGFKGLMSVHSPACISAAVAEWIAVKFDIWHF